MSPTDGGRRRFLDLFPQCFQLSGAVPELFRNLSLHLRCGGTTTIRTRRGEKDERIKSVKSCRGVFTRNECGVLVSVV